jgi:peptidoglycan/LPS O-acetylase OafA/YrhL
MTTTTKRKDIQIYRGVALLAVVLYHLNEEIFPNGFLGVDLFFVISGFVITPKILRIYQSDNTRTRICRIYAFYNQRFWRLAPAFSLSCVISAIFILLYGLPNDHSNFAKLGIYSILMVANLGAYKFQGDYFNSSPNPLIHHWSLSVEMQIYFILPLFLFTLLTCKLLRIHNIKNFLYCCCLISLILFVSTDISSILYQIIGITDPVTFTFYSTISRFWEFCFGGLAFLMSEKHKHGLPKVIRAFILIFLALTLFSSLRVTIVTQIVFVLLIAILLMSNTKNYRFNSFLNCFYWLGERSYSIYLYHFPLIYLVRYSVFPQEFYRNYLLSISLFIIIIFIGALSYAKIETRFRYRNRLQNDN